MLWRCDPTRVMASSFLKFLDHIQQRTTVGSTPLDERSARRRDLYLTTHNTHNRQTFMPPVRFEHIHIYIYIYICICIHIYIHICIVFISYDLLENCLLRLPEVSLTSLHTPFAMSSACWKFPTSMNGKSDM